jgi:hypothetical protein
VRLNIGEWNADLHDYYDKIGLRPLIQVRNQIMINPDRHDNQWSVLTPPWMEHGSSG